MLKSINRLLFYDFSCVYRLLPRHLKTSIWLTFALMVLLAFAELSTVLTITAMGQSLGNPDVIRNNILVAKFFEIFPQLQVWSADNRNIVLLTSYTVVFAIFLKIIMAALCTYKTVLISEQISAFVGEEIMRRYLYSDYAWHLSSESKNLFHSMRVRNCLASMALSLLSIYVSLITIVILLVSLIIKSPILSPLVVGTCGVVGILIYRSVRNKIDKSGINASLALKDENNALLNGINGIREVLIYGQQDSFIKTLSDSIRKGIQPKVFIALANPMPSWILEIVGFAMVSASIYFLINVNNASMSEITGVVALITITAWRVLPYLNKIIGHLVSVRASRLMGMVCLETFEILSRCKKIKPISSGQNFKFESEIILKDVSFKYPHTEIYSLKNINLKISKGTQFGIIGSSGAGKSTLIDIISGLLLPTEGKFIVDGKKLDAENLSAYKKIIGYVPQSAFLIDSSLAANIAFSEWGKPINESRVKQVCKMAAMDFVFANEKGIYMDVSTNGIGLSGGQKQRLAIARALYPDTSLLLFDEATSSLDQGNEALIQKTINSFSNDMTCVIISHRPSTVENCDHLIWIENGVIIAEGKPHEILPKFAKHAKQCIADEDNIN